MSISQLSPNVIAVDMEVGDAGYEAILMLHIVHDQPGNVSLVFEPWGCIGFVPNVNFGIPTTQDYVAFWAGGCPGVGHFSGSGRLLTITFTPSP
jgi:hypothetical protein